MYYTHPQNGFWKICAARAPDLRADYVNRLKALRVIAHYHGRMGQPYVIPAVLGAVASAVATPIVSALSQRWARRNPLGPSRAATPPIPMPRLARFRLERRMRPLVRALAAALIITVMLAKETSVRSHVLNVAAILEVAGMVGLSIVTLIIDWTTRCSGCGLRMLLESRDSPPYPPPRRQIESVRVGGFQCMYCGQRYAV